MKGCDTLDYIAIVIEKERIVFSNKSEYLKNENIVKIFTHKERYLKNNIKLVSSNINNYINELDLNINEIMINNFEIIAISLKIIKKLEIDKSIIIKDNEILNSNICNQILNMDNVKMIECYDVEEEMLDKLEEKNIEVHLKTEILNISNFVFDNKLNLYEDIYYREKVFFRKNITNKDITGFNKFCEINEHLKQIDILCEFNIDDIKKIIDILIKNNLTSVDINIYPEIIGTEKINEIVSELKKINNKTKKKKGIKITSKYSDYYKGRNYLKQVNFYNLKIATLIIIFVVLAELSYMGYYLYVSYKTDNEIKNLKPNNNVVITEENKINEDNSNDIEEPEVIEQTEEPKKIEPLVQDFSKLKEINPDTVAWLKVNNTIIDYPVVKAKDNEYYLNKNFYKNKSLAGWIFMDYRNDVDELDKNTIIYGHSGLKKAIMFAGLKEALNERWYKNPENQIITLNTINENTKWQIFSIYVTEPTFNYIDTFFINDDDFSKFIYKIKDRSIYDFGIDISLDDKILTLTTCYEQGTKRLAIHAKMIK